LSRGFDSTSQSYAPDRQSQTVLVRTSTTSYEKRFPDGSKQVFTLTDGATSAPRRIFMTQWIDRAGNAVTLGYDSSLRLKTISDALNQTTTLSYDLPSDSFKITKVTEPFSTARFANFDYDGTGRLTTITDEIGIQSTFTYAADGTSFINSLQTALRNNTLFHRTIRDRSMA
jgi:YD repeat-containing protein